MNSEELRELCSALADGELPEARANSLVERLAGDEGLRREWALSHLARDALRDHLTNTVDREFAGRVAVATAAEPVSIASRRRARHGLLPPLTGLALAASVAAVAVIGLRSWLEADSDAVGRSASQVAQVAAPAAPAAPATPATRWSVDKPEVEARLNAYLFNHSESMGHDMRGMHPYARIVGYYAGE